MATEMVWVFFLEIEMELTSSQLDSDALVPLAFNRALEHRLNFRDMLTWQRSCLV